MIFLGDIAVPEEKYAERLDKQFERHTNIFSGQDLIINLEGLIMDDFSVKSDTPILFNDSSILPVLKKWKTVAATLANNHTLDRPSKFKDTARSLTNYSIGFTGAGTSNREANEPVEFESSGTKVIMFNQCWHVMLQHQQNPDKGIYVATIDGNTLITAVKSARQKNPDAAIVVNFHWNFDLEVYPFPAHRKLSMDLIDAGVNIVVGCHSHCIQGGEKYKEGYIVYGLGNFFVPWYTFIDGHISFPEFAQKEMAFEWDPKTNKANVHFFHYNPANDSHQLKHKESAVFEECTWLKRYSPYAGMNHKEYCGWFKKNRRKKGGVPVYKSYDLSITNHVKDIIIINRIRFIRSLAKLKIRDWNN